GLTPVTGPCDTRRSHTLMAVGRTETRAVVSIRSTRTALDRLGEVGDGAFVNRPRGPGSSFMSQPSTRPGYPPAPAAAVLPGRDPDAVGAFERPEPVPLAAACLCVGDLQSDGRASPCHCPSG